MFEALYEMRDAHCRRQHWEELKRNGLGNAEKLARFAPTERIAIGITMVPADLVTPGELHMTGAGETHVIMASGAEDAALSALAAALNEAGLVTSVDPPPVAPERVTNAERGLPRSHLTSEPLIGCSDTPRPCGGFDGDRSSPGRHQA